MNGEFNISDFDCGIGRYVALRYEPLAFWSEPCPLKASSGALIHSPGQDAPLPIPVCEVHRLAFRAEPTSHTERANPEEVYEAARATLLKIQLAKRIN